MAGIDFLARQQSNSYSNSGSEFKNALYNGEPLNLFLYQNGGDPLAARQLIKDNKLESAFSIPHSIVLRVRQVR